MSDNIEAIIRQCKCGHNRTTHYFDTQGPGNCLDRCDCAGYHDRDLPGDYPKQKTPTPGEGDRRL